MFSVFSFSEAATGSVLWKKVFLKISQNSWENTFGLRNFQKHLFLQNTSRQLLLLLAFRSSHRRCSMKKGVLENFQKFKRKHIWFAKFQKHLFYRTPLDDCFWFFRATLLKLGTANSVWKNSNENSLSRKTNLRSTVQVYYFFFRQDKLSVYVVIGLHCLLREAATRVEVFCKKGCSWRFRKFRRKTPVLESFFNKVSGLTLILKNIGQQLLLHCTRTTHCYFIRFTFAFF